MNKIQVIGNVGKSAEIKTTAAGKSMARFSMADTNGTGEYRKTQWFNVIIWGQPAEEFAPRIQKGMSLELEGRLDIQTYVKKDGTTGFSPTIHCDRIFFEGDTQQETPEEDDGVKL